MCLFHAGAGGGCVGSWTSACLPACLPPSAHSGRARALPPVFRPCLPAAIWVHSPGCPWAGRALAAFTAASPAWLLSQFVSCPSHAIPPPPSSLTQQGTHPTPQAGQGGCLLAVPFAGLGRPWQTVRPSRSLGANGGLGFYGGCFLQGGSCRLQGWPPWQGGCRRESEQLLATVGLFFRKLESCQSLLLRSVSLSLCRMPSPLG